jgi:hypothetical protein
MAWGWGVQGGGRVVWPLHAAESKGQENLYSEWKKFDFMSSTIYKISWKITGNSINNLFF